MLKYFIYIYIINMSRKLQRSLPTKLRKSKKPLTISEKRGSFSRKKASLTNVNNTFFFDTYLEKIKNKSRFNYIKITPGFQKHIIDYIKNKLSIRYTNSRDSENVSGFNNICDLHQKVNIVDLFKIDVNNLHVKLVNNPMNNNFIHSDLNTYNLIDLDMDNLNLFYEKYFNMDIIKSIQIISLPISSGSNSFVFLIKLKCNNLSYVLKLTSKYNYAITYKGNVLCFSGNEITEFIDPSNNPDLKMKHFKNLKQEVLNYNLISDMEYINLIKTKNTNFNSFINIVDYEFGPASVQLNTRLNKKFGILTRKLGLKHKSFNNDNNFKLILTTATSNPDNITINVNKLINILFNYEILQNGKTIKKDIKKFIIKKILFNVLKQVYLGLLKLEYLKLCHNDLHTENALILINKQYIDINDDKKLINIKINMLEPIEKKLFMKTPSYLFEFEYIGCLVKIFDFDRTFNYVERFNTQEDKNKQNFGIYNDLIYFTFLYIHEINEQNKLYSNYYKNQFIEFLNLSLFKIDDEITKFVISPRNLEIYLKSGKEIKNIKYNQTYFILTNKAIITYKIKNNDLVNILNPLNIIVQNLFVNIKF